MKLPIRLASLAFGMAMVLTTACQVSPPTVPIDNDASGITYHFRPCHLSSIGAPPRHHMLSIDLLYFTSHQA